jgi:ribosomal protein L7/L12
MESVFMLVALLVVFLVLWPIESRVGRAEKALRRVERKIDLVMEHLGIEEPELVGLAEVDALMDEGEKIQAIKRYRELTGAGLKDAKEAVEKRQSAR